jgi:hypothetical protein
VTREQPPNWIDRTIERARHHPIVVVVGLIAALIIGMGAFTDALESIISFSKHHFSGGTPPLGRSMPIASSEEQEPNDHVSKANWIELGKTYRGTLRRGQDPIDYFAFSTTGIDAVYVRVLVRVLRSGGDFGNFGVTATLLEYETERQIGEETAIYGKNLSHAFELVPGRKYFLRLSLFTNLSHHCTYELRLTPEGEG